MTYVTYAEKILKKQLKELFALPKAHRLATPAEHLANPPILCLTQNGTDTEKK